MKDKQKKELLALSKLCGALFAFFFVSGAVLVFCCAAANALWRAGLKEQTFLVLEKKYPGEYAVGDFIPFGSAFSVRGAAYALNKAGGGVPLDSYAVITRVITAYGPVVCVFVCGSGKAVFEGFAPGSEAVNFDSPLLLSQISYWEKRIPSLKLLPERGAGRGST